MQPPDRKRMQLFIYQHKIILSGFRLRIAYNFIKFGVWAPVSDARAIWEMVQHEGRSSVTAGPHFDYCDIVKVSILRDAVPQQLVKQVYDNIGARVSNDRATEAHLD